MNSIILGGAGVKWGEGERMDKPPEDIGYKAAKGERRY
jgi:hypothetical protein